VWLAMSGIMTKWLVAQEHTVGTEDLDREGLVSDDAVERWVAGARQAYLDRCPLLRRAADRPGVTLRQFCDQLPPGARLGRRPDTVYVTASATEFHPGSFTISFRLRPAGGDRDTPVNARCRISLENAATGEQQDLGNEIRDELIALEHSARHAN
jgi:acyl-CoA thioesterase FadM